jgi:hypothetical protein
MIKKKIINYLDIIFNFLFKAFYSLGKKYQAKKIDFIEICIYKFIEIITKSYVVVHKNVSLKETIKKQDAASDAKFKNTNKCAILVQGPIYKEFTLESIKILRNQNPRTAIYFSTWDNENKKILSSISNYADHIILNKSDNSDPGHLNMNLQIKTTSNGLLQIKKDKFKYALKMRSDEFISSYNVCEKLKDLLEIFPIKKNNSSLKKRIITLEVHLFSSWHVPDRFMFGRVEDLLKFWNINSCTIETYQKIYPLNGLNDKKDFFSKFHKYGSVEHYLTTKFCHKINFFPENKVHTWLKFISTKLIIIDRESIGHQWPKHDHMKFAKYNFFKRPIFLDSYIDFKIWFRLYNNFNNVYKKNFEKIYSQKCFLDKLIF